MAQALATNRAGSTIMVSLATRVPTLRTSPLLPGSNAASAAARCSAPNGANTSSIDLAIEKPMSMLLAPTISGTFAPPPAA